MWARGHSSENYFFDFATLRTPLRSLSVIDRSHEALSLFERVFESAIRLACIASLAGDEVQRLGVVSASVNRQILEILPAESGEMLVPDHNVWEKNLVRNNQLSASSAKKLIERAHSWHNIVESSNWHVVRWMCHGHIGLAFIWAAYSRCVLETYLRDERFRKDCGVSLSM